MTTHQTPPAVAPRKTNPLAIATMLTGFFGFCCIPLLLGPFALLHVRQTGEKGRALAITGMLASLAWITVLTVLA
ncbi:DUF4190 domain-containing protein [Nocardia yamanashiensis]|uniref:DUF4190 domain-containing protein n=1 Tax=Nocardia yamanashiensis TaxID=209247 RepID=UPI00082CA911|nr:DUF4190 domain-containing protein [Nocardia yamanashiensis]